MLRSGDWVKVSSGAYELKDSIGIVMGEVHYNVTFPYEIYVLELHETYPFMESEIERI